MMRLSSPAAQRASSSVAASDHGAFPTLRLSFAVCLYQVPFPRAPSYLRSIRPGRRHGCHHGSGRRCSWGDYQISNVCSCAVHLRSALDCLNSQLATSPSESQKKNTSACTRGMCCSRLFSFFRKLLLRSACREQMRGTAGHIWR